MQPPHSPTPQEELHLQVALSHGGQALPVSVGRSLVLQASDGSGQLQVSLTHEGLVVECLHGRMHLRAAGTLELSAAELRLHATQDLALQAGGDLQLQAGGALQMQAATVELQATTGDARIEANDDVRIEGERIRMNA